MKYVIAIIVLIFSGACNRAGTEKYFILLKPSTTDPQLIQEATDILSKRLETVYKKEVAARVKGTHIEIVLHEKVNLKEFLPLVLTQGKFTLREIVPDNEIVTRMIDIDPLAKEFGSLRVNPSRDMGVVGETGLLDTIAVMQSPAYKTLKSRYSDMDLLWGKETAQWTIRLYAVRKSDNPISNDAVESAAVDFDGSQGKENVGVILRKEYHDRWLEMTRANISKAIAICLDNRVLSAPIVFNEIPGGRLSISSVDEHETRMLAAIIGSKVLPLSLSVESVDPTLEKRTQPSNVSENQISRYNDLQKEFLHYRHKIDSLVESGSGTVNTQPLRRELARIYYQDLASVVEETNMSRGQIDMYLEEIHTLLSTFKAHLDPEGKSPNASTLSLDSLLSGE